MFRRHYVPILVICVWLLFLGFAVWQHAGKSSQPPIYDALNYVEKARNFWDNIQSGQFRNPFNLELTFRPPGTVVMSYPFGYTDALQGFYFRSVYLPVLLLVVSVYIIGFHATADVSRTWALTVIAMLFSTLPMFYHFEPSSRLVSPAPWGFVDNFLAGTAALATAAFMRSAWKLSRQWLVLAALAGGFCILVKPTGGVFMFLAWTGWILAVGVKLFRCEKDSGERKVAARFFLWGTAVVTAVYGSVLLGCFTSQYLSKGNIAFGKKATAILHTQWTPSVSLTLLLTQTMETFGYVLPILIIAACIYVIMFGLKSLFLDVGASGNETGAAFTVSFLSTVLGVWFWLGETSIDQIRYFFPFALTAAVGMVPLFIRLIEASAVPMKRVLYVACLLPTLNLVFLINIPDPPVRWQALSGVNHTAGSLAGEVADARRFIRDTVRRERTLSVYTFDSGLPVVVVESAFRYEAFRNPSLLTLDLRSPVSWQMDICFRLNEIVESDYILFEPLNEAKAKEEILAKQTIDSFSDERLLMRAVFTGFAEEDGVTVILERPGLRMLRVADRARLGESLFRLRRMHTWRPVFLDANSSHRTRVHQPVTKEEELRFVRQADGGSKSLRFGREFMLLGLKAAKTAEGLQVRLLWQSLETQQLGYSTAVHLVDGSGNMLANFDYIQDRAHHLAETGIVWMDMIDIPDSKLTNAACVKIGIYSMPGIKLLEVSNKTSVSQGFFAVVDLKRALATSSSETGNMER